VNELIVFAKAPRAGFVKTRLAQGSKMAGGADGIGDLEACHAYEMLLKVLSKNLAGIQNAVVAHAPADARPELERFLPAHWDYRAQEGRDLGERLERAFEHSFGSGARRVVIIGSDCPEVSASDIECAWRKLESADVVFGPATDGGYWLIGGRAVHPNLFRAIAWGSNLVLKQSLEITQRLQLKTELLRELADVDTPEDWARFKATLRPRDCINRSE
jgi:rSAM/selenodomain-associated transferase 1